MKDQKTKKIYKSGNRAGRSRNRSKGYSDSVNDDVKRDSGNGDYHHAYNDWNWYVPDESLLRGSASLAFDNAAGDQNIPLNPLAKGNVTALPGVMAIEYVPTWGMSGNASSPLNVSMRHAYTQLIRPVTSNPPFEFTDYFFYMGAMDSVYLHFNQLVRIYGILHSYEYKNRYTPDVILESMNIDVNDFRTHINDMYFRLVMMASKISKRPVPNNMSLLVRHSWLATNVFKDADNDKAQMYLYYTRTGYRYNVVDTVAQLEPVKLNDGKLTYEYYMSWVEGLISNVMADQDFDTVAAYILKSYEGNLFYCSMQDPAYEVHAAYDPSVLTQLHNADIVQLKDFSTLSVQYKVDEVANPYLLTDPMFESHIAKTGSKWLDVMVPNPEPKDIMEATRLCVLGADNELDPNTKMWTTGTGGAFGTEVVINVSVYTYLKSANGFNIWSFDVPDYVAQDSTTMSPAKLAVLSKFDYHPLLPVGEWKSASGEFTCIDVFGDLMNATPMSWNDLAKMNLTAQMGEFGAFR